VSSRSGEASANCYTPLYFYFTQISNAANSCEVWITSDKKNTRLTALFSRTTQVSLYQKGKTNLDFTEARDSEWQWHQLGHMQVCTLFQTDNHTTTHKIKKQLSNQGYC